VYESPSLNDGVDVLQLLQQCDPSWRLVLVGDALMSPWELQAHGSRIVSELVEYSAPPYWCSR